MTDLLSTLVTGAAAKRLTAVEARPDRSNQHEFNGVQALKALFGETRATREARFIYLSENESDVKLAEGFVTWYDAREDHPTRSEFRLYFPRTDASEGVQEQDLAVVLRRPDDSVLVIFAGEGSTAERQLLWLFGLESPVHGVEVRDLRHNDAEVGFAAREVLDQLGIEPAIGPPAEESYLEVLLDRFGGGFPPTVEFSEFARGVTPDVDPVEDPDGTLIAWLQREEALFRQLERHLVLSRLRQGFGDDVEAFVKFSLSVQNRRKSRVGYALEHHLQAILEANAIPHARAPVTERTSRPDFLFPSIAAYRDREMPVERLAMLAVKSTCKDRWRQILAEADRLPVKHLLTLEPGISSAQTGEMTARSVVLVIPVEIHNTFTAAQRRQILTVRAFLDRLKT
jgi:EcoRII C terminal